MHNLHFTNLHTTCLFLSEKANCNVSKTLSKSVSLSAIGANRRFYLSKFYCFSLLFSVLSLWMRLFIASGNSNASSPPQSPNKSNNATVNNLYPETNALTNGGGSSNGNSRMYYIVNNFLFAFLVEAQQPKVKRRRR